MYIPYTDNEKQFVIYGFKITVTMVIYSGKKIKAVYWVHSVYVNYY